VQVCHRLQPLRRLLDYPVILVKEVGVGLQVWPANAPAELVQSAHPEGLRVLNYHSIHPRNVDSILDDGGSSVWDTLGWWCHDKKDIVTIFSPRCQYSDHGILIVVHNSVGSSLC
jgi:hypothetical protein